MTDPDRRARAIASAVVLLAACKDPVRSPDPATVIGSAAPSDAAPQATPNATIDATPDATPNATPNATPDATPNATIVHHAPSVVVMDEPRIELPREESFRLLDAGRGARSVLRYALTPGTSTFTARTTLSSRHLEGAQFTPPVALPAVRDGFAITTVADHSERLALHALAGEAAQTTPETDAYLAPWRTRLADRRIAVTLDDRGRFAAIRFDDDPDGSRSEQARDELAQRLLTTIVPLPEEPVGAGASWRVVTILRQGPAHAKQTATYTLTSRSAAAWKLHVKLQRVAAEQHLADPTLPRGTSADLLALFRSFEGDVTGDPAHPLITGGALAIESRMHVRVQDAGQPAAEQMFEDTGRVTFALCSPAAHPAPRAANDPLGPCPAGLRPKLP